MAIYQFKITPNVFPTILSFMKMLKIRIIIFKAKAVFNRGLQ